MLGQGPPKGPGKPVVATSRNPEFAQILNHLKWGYDVCLEAQGFPYHSKIQAYSAD